MKTYRSILLLFVFLLTALSGISQEKNPSTPFFFIQVTDPQFGFFESNKGFSKETELYEKAVSGINLLHPDFVVITGDLVNNKDDKSQIEEFKRITSKISPSIPVWYSPGNHDIGQSPAQQDIDNFISRYGHDRFSFSHKNCLFIGLNSCLIKSNIQIMEQLQFEWLNKELSKGGGMNKGLKGLEERVISQDLCAACGACLSLCPYQYPKFSRTVPGTYSASRVIP